MSANEMFGLPPGELWVQWKHPGDRERQWVEDSHSTANHLLRDPDGFDGDTWTRDVFTLCGRKVGEEISVANSPRQARCRACERIAALRRS